MILRIGVWGTIINVIFCMIFLLTHHPHDFAFTQRLYIDGPSYFEGAMKMIDHGEWLYPIGDIYHSSATQILYSYLFRVFPVDPLTVKIFNWFLWVLTIAFVFVLSKKIWKKNHVAWFSCFLYSSNNLGQKFVATCQYEVILLFLVSLLFLILSSEQFGWRKTLLSAFVVTGCAAFHTYLIILGFVAGIVFYIKKVQRKAWLGFVLPFLIGGIFLFSSHLIHNTKNSFFENWFSFHSPVRPEPRMVPRPLSSYSVLELGSKYSDFLYHNYLRLPDKWLKVNAPGYNFPYPEGEKLENRPWEYVKLVGRHYQFFWGLDRDLWYVDSYLQVLLGESSVGGFCSFYHTSNVIPGWCIENYVWGSRELNLILTLLELALFILGFFVWFKKYFFQAFLVFSFIFVFLLPLFIIGGSVRFQVPLLLLLSLLKFQGLYYLWSTWVKKKILLLFPKPEVTRFE